MIDADADLELMASIRQYQRINEGIVRIQSRICRHRNGLESVLRSFRDVMDISEDVSSGTAKLHKQCGEMDWEQMVNDAELLNSMIVKKHEIEATLRQAGIDSVIRPDWEVVSTVRRKE
ncbi:MAG: hypothetical protein F4Z87_07245 [Gammaproteobacteria bacterium]|nr:hypothetical protein [Gammaproteobacteria bacterium]